MYIAHYDSVGDYLWAKTVPEARPLSMAIDSEGNTVVTGRFHGWQADFGGGALPWGGFNDIFILKLDAQGKHVWSESFPGEGGSRNDYGEGIHIDSDDNIYVCGYYRSDEIDFGGGVHSLSIDYGAGLFVARFNPSGDFVWSRDLGVFEIEYWAANTSGSLKYSRDLAVDETGTIYVAGSFGEDHLLLCGETPQTASFFGLDAIVLTLHQ